MPVALCVLGTLSVSHVNQTMASATQVNLEDNSFGKKYIVGYEIRTRDGTVHKLPSCTVLSSARETINARLAEKKIPKKDEVKVPRPR